ncbi:hypothetical protein BASA50_005313 [Batrachochytrium salamandrivorans]|uniref:CSC1/OSCA1-like 7TM region domain-containing protein n=1 Tax=Batrachochytrium salamandrivorans TaxID=1357716 RepID=A0ABQ8FDA3_9FUNG|nr:hypothetical protein BASA60_005163 [Batrachochytrium salamandrivorans]KAH6596269.1 hypothetical protein BASA50_005313 [Batrachochytrium salamandrivorans]
MDAATAPITTAAGMGCNAASRTNRISIISSLFLLIALVVFNGPLVMGAIPAKLLQPTAQDAHHESPVAPSVLQELHEFHHYSPWPAVLPESSNADFAPTLMATDLPKPKTKQNQGIVVPFMTFLTIGLVCLLIFCVVRTCFLDIYSPRRVLTRGRPPKLKRGLLSWIPVVFTTKESLLITTIGLDGVMFLRFFKMGYKMFGLFTILGMGILAPTNYYARPPKLSNVTGYKLEDLILPALSVNNVPNQSEYLRVHLAFTWIFSLLTLGYIVAFYRGYVLLKLQYDEYALRQTKMSKIEMRSVMVFGIPRELRNEVDLASYFESLGVGNVENVVLCRNWSHLRKNIQTRAFYLNKLETVFSQLSRRRTAHDTPSFFKSAFRSVFSCCMRSSPAPRRQWQRLDMFRGNSAVRVSAQLTSEHSPLLPRRAFGSSDAIDPSVLEVLSRIDAMNPRWRPQHRTGFLGLFGPLVDSAEYYAAKFNEFDRQVARYRRMPERSAPTAVGIVSFESPLSATLVSQALVQRRPFACMTKMAPEPRDIYWPNLSSKTASSYTKLIRSLLVVISLFLLVFSSTFVVSSIAGLIDLERLAVYIPVLGAVLKDIPDTWIQFIQGVIPALLLSLWTSSLPSLLLFLSQAQGLEAASWIEMSLLTKYFFYQLWNILFVTVFARTLVYEIIPNPQKVIELLGQMVPKASTTLVNYVILQAAAVYPAQLLLAAPLIVTWISRFSPWSRNTPRQISDAYYPSILTCINYGIVYPGPIMIFVIGVVYAPISPLILPFCTLFFAMGYFIFKYLLMYVHLPRYESKGIATPLAVNRCLMGLVIMQFTMMGLLGLKASADGGASTKTRHNGPTFGPAASEATPWSAYAQMVIGVLPLPVITAFVYGWLNNGYAKQVLHIPLEILGKVAAELIRNMPEQSSDTASSSHPNVHTRGAGNDNGGAYTSNNGSGASVPPTILQGMRSLPGGRSNIGRELNEFTPRRPTTLQSRNRDASGRLSINGSAVRPTVNAAAIDAGNLTISPTLRSPELPLGLAGANSSTSSFTSFHTSPERSTSAIPQATLNRKVSTLSMQTGRFSLFEEGPNEQSPFDALGANDPDTGRQRSGQEEESLLLSALDQEECISLGIHLEPPMTRVPGILDAPVQSASSILRYGDEVDLVNRNTMGNGTDGDPMLDDLNVHTYIHPALVGRLPIAWLPERQQPPRLSELRDEQTRNQREVWRRLVFKQRVGVRVAVSDSSPRCPLYNDGSETLAYGSRGLSVDETLLEPRFGDQDANGPAIGRIRSFVDGFASWVHLTMS